MSDRRSDVARIRDALEEAGRIVRPFTPGDIDFECKEERGDPVTEADHALDAALKAILPSEGEGWLSEETRDDPIRLEHRRVWVVDPLDGTREFVEGIAEWCVSVGLVEDGTPVAGGILNPATGELVVGSVETGVTYNGEPAELTNRTTLDGARVLASRSEVRRSEWERFADAPFEVVPCGSVAYKLGLVAAGKADATWTLVPKHEWDVAAGAALVRAAGGLLLHADGTEPAFNRPDPKLPNFLAGPPSLLADFRRKWLAGEADRAVS